MEIDFDNDQGLKLFDEIMIEEEFIKTGLDTFTKVQHDVLDIKIDNILNIAAGKDYSNMNYRTDIVGKLPAPNPEKQKNIFETTSKTQAEKINLMKSYFSTKELKPLQDYLDKLLEG